MNRKIHFIALALMFLLIMITTSYYSGIWYMAFILASLLAMVLLGSFATIALALATGNIVLIGWMAIFQDAHILYPVLIINAGVFVTAGGVIGAIFGERTAARLEKLAVRWKHTTKGLIIGVLTGLFALVPVVLSN